MKEAEVFKVLASADRQIMLHELSRIDDKVTEEELSRRIAARRHEISPEAICEEKTKRAHIRLVHQHLPLLLDLNVIKRDGDKVTLTDGGQDQCIEAAKTIDAWPPDEGRQSSTS